MKTRRHHNNRGERQIRNGSTRRQVDRMARRLGVCSGQRHFFQATIVGNGEPQQVIPPTKCRCGAIDLSNPDGPTPDITIIYPVPDVGRK